MMHKRMNVKLALILLFAVVNAAVIPKDKNEEQKPIEKLADPTPTPSAAKPNESDVKATTNKTLLSLTTPLRKAEIKEKAKHEDGKDKKPVDEAKPNEKPQDDRHLQADPPKDKNEEKYGQLEEEKPKTSGIRVLLFIIVLIVCACIAHTFRKKLMGFFIGLRRGNRRGNVRYKRLSTDAESAIE